MGRADHQAYSARPAGQARGQSVLPTALLPKHPLGDVVAPEIGGTQVAERDLGGFVAGLAHQLGKAGAGIAGGGGEPGAQAVPGVAPDRARHRGPPA